MDNAGRQVVSEDRDKALSELYAYFIDKLKSNKGNRWIKSF